MLLQLRNHKKLWSHLFWIWTILIIILTAMPYNPDNIVKDRDYWVRPDYLEHISFYIILAVLFVPYFLNKGKGNRYFGLILWVITGILFAAITEFYQLYIPNRAFNYWDMFLNVGGIIIGLPLGFYLFRSRERGERREESRKSGSKGS